MERNGMGRDGMGRNGMGRDGKGLEGIGRDGNGWEGMGKDRKSFLLLGIWYALKSNESLKFYYLN